MRADRLLALLLLLQARGQVTAAEVAEELEVSERTARRDLEALATAGVPVYSRRGRHGGWQLVGGARTDLTGLTAAETRALFLVAGPASATPEVRTALRKLVRALPEPFRAPAEAASQAVAVDPAWWGRSGGERPAPAHLESLQVAVVDGTQVRLDYVARDRRATRRVVHPLGLATRASVWYLVADTDAGLRSFRVDRVQAVEATGDPVVRPDGFDLAEAWRMIGDRFEPHPGRVAARAIASRDAVWLLREVLGTNVRIGPTDADGQVEVEVAARSVEALAGTMAGFGASVEVVDPPEVRARLAELAAELSATYGP